ncbi:MAG: hypothetical protein ACOYM3_23285 [Terrimicrobiaceae bacterium]
MTNDHPENWFLKKYETAEVFGPIRFDQIRAWAKAAQVNPQDMVSTDREVWTKAPMIPDFAMDWLIEVSVDLLYGPTTAEALMEFSRLGEITKETHILNCRTGEIMALGDAPFFSDEAMRPAVEDFPQPPKGGIKINLQKRIRDLESALMEKHRQLGAAQETILKLETRIHDFEKRIADIRGGRK